MAYLPSSLGGAGPGALKTFGILWSCAGGFSTMKEQHSQSQPSHNTIHIHCRQSWQLHIITKVLVLSQRLTFTSVEEFAVFRLQRWVVWMGRRYAQVELWIRVSRRRFLVGKMDGTHKRPLRRVFQMHSSQPHISLHNIGRKYMKVVARRAGAFRLDAGAMLEAHPTQPGPQSLPIVSTTSDDASNGAFVRHCHQERATLIWNRNVCIQKLKPKHSKQKQIRNIPSRRKNAYNVVKFQAPKLQEVYSLPNGSFEKRMYEQAQLTNDWMLTLVPFTSYWLCRCRQTKTLCG